MKKTAALLVEKWGEKIEIQPSKDEGTTGNFEARDGATGSAALPGLSRLYPWVPGILGGMSCPIHCVFSQSQASAFRTALGVEQNGKHRFL